MTVGVTNLTRGQVATLIMIGFVLWLFAAILLRALTPHGAFDGWGRVATYALTVPGTLPFVQAAGRLARLPRGELTPGIALVTATALLMDGLAFGWFPQFYGDRPLDCASAVFWGAGVGLVLAIALDRRTSNGS